MSEEKVLSIFLILGRNSWVGCKPQTERGRTDSHRQVPRLIFLCMPIFNTSEKLSSGYCSPGWGLVSLMAAVFAVKVSLKRIQSSHSLFQFFIHVDSKFQIFNQFFDALFSKTSSLTQRIFKKTIAWRTPNTCDYSVSI